MRFIIGNGSRDYRVWLVGQREDHESWWCGFSLKTNRLETQEELMFESEDRRMLMLQFEAGGIHSYLGKVSLFVLSRPLMSWKRPTHTGRAACFIQSTNSNVHPTQKHPGITFNQISRFPKVQSAWHTKLIITTPLSLPPSIRHLS